ncbi:MAG: DUF4919 domain-containing protein [Acidobacteriota bacterium]|nr:DUF4919 domain-containing protein [Acidobacteriota bacterium]
MNKTKFIGLLLSLFVFAFTATAQDAAKAGAGKAAQEKTTATTATAKDYEDLLGKLKKGDTSVDFKKLRFAFTETKNYSPYGNRSEDSSKMLQFYREKNYKEALKSAEKVLETTYVDLNAHFVAALSSNETGNAEKAEFHKKVYLGLINSIIEGRDGKSAKTAFEVIYVPEEYALLNYLGYRRGSQALVTENGSKFDVLTVTNPENNETLKLYFNIDTVWKGYEKVFGK